MDWFWVWLGDWCRGWMKSPGHRANLMNPRYTKIGIGIVAKGGYVYATQIFAG